LNLARDDGTPPNTLSRDLIARALAYHLHEQRLGGLDPHLRRLLATLARSPGPIRHLKIGSVIIREHEGKIHEVMVASGGFCWSRQIHSSLSTIARKITGTSWNGPRFFGLREKEPHIFGVTQVRLCVRGGAIVGHGAAA
jgi:hypothetical protein